MIEVIMIVLKIELGRVGREKRELGEWKIGRLRRKEVRKEREEVGVKKEEEKGGRKEKKRRKRKRKEEVEKDRKKGGGRGTTFWTPEGAYGS